MDAPEQLHRKKNLRLRAHRKDRPDPVHAWAIRTLFRLLNLRMVVGMPPLSRQDLFKWATKSTSLACQNLMIAAEALGMNTCPMEGFDGRRLSQYLGLSGRHHEIVMVIAIGKKSRTHNDPPQWRRPLDAPVTVISTSSRRKRSPMTF